MRIAFIILVHKNPSQVERLVKKLNHPGFDFYIHLDAKNDLKEFDYLSELSNTSFIKNRVNVRWGSYNIVEAILVSMKQIFASGKKYDFISVISGQDYPIKSNEAIYSFFDAHIGKNFLQYEAQPSAWWNHAITRIELYHFTNFDFRGRYKIQFLMNNLLPKRNFPLPYKLYGAPGGGWWTLSSDCARYVLDFITNDRKFKRFVNYTWAPDEFLVQTIVLNSDFKNSVINDNLYFMDWSESEHHPTTLKMNDFEALKNTGKLLARKFDIKIDTKILDNLDEFTKAG